MSEIGGEINDLNIKLKDNNGSDYIKIEENTVKKEKL